MGICRWHGLHLIKAGANGQGQSPCRGSAAQDGTEPSTPGMGILPGQRPDTHQPRPLPIPGQPALSSIDESNPLYYNKLHLPLPQNPHPPPPSTNRPHIPILWGWRVPLLNQCHVLSRPAVLARPEGLRMQRAGQRCYSR